MVKIMVAKTTHCLIGAAGLKVLVFSPHNPDDNFLVLPPGVLQQHPEQADLSLLPQYVLQEIDEQVGLIARFADCLEARSVAVTAVHQLRDSADRQIKNSNLCIILLTGVSYNRPHLVPLWCNVGLCLP